MFEELKETISEEIKENMTMMFYQIEHINKER